MTACCKTDCEQQRCLLVFSDDWGRHPSSCQHLIKHLSTDWRILWVNTIGTRQPRPDLFTLRRGWEKLRSWSGGVRQVSRQMWVLDSPMLPLSDSWAARWLNRQICTHWIRSAMRQLRFSAPVVLTTLPFTPWLLGDVGQRGLVYYCTDDYSQWPSANRSMLQAAECDIRAEAQLVLAASRALERLHQDAARCHFFPHAVDFDHFASTTTITQDPLAHLSRPRIGFFGLIYEKLDFPLLTALAKQLPHTSLVMIGPVAYCPTEFSRLPNVKLVGQQPYDQLPQWLAGLDVLLMPYVKDAMIVQSSPLKLLECLATGKPTVSVDIPAVRSLQPYVHVAATSDQFIAHVKSALDNPESQDVIHARQRFAQRSSWSDRAHQLHELLSAIQQNDGKHPAWGDEFAQSPSSAHG